MSICDGSSGAKLKVEYSDDESLAWNDGGHTWNNVSDVSGRLNVSGGEISAEEYKAFTDLIIGFDEPGLLSVELDAVFKNVVNSFLEFITDEYEARTCWYLRWSYNSGNSGALRRTALVFCTTAPYTGGDANSAQPVVKSLTLVTDTINRDTVP